MSAPNLASSSININSMIPGVPAPDSPSQRRASQSRMSSLISNESPSYFSEPELPQSPPAPRLDSIQQYIQQRTIAPPRTNLNAPGEPPALFLPSRCSNRNSPIHDPQDQVIKQSLTQSNNSNQVDLSISSQSPLGSRLDPIKFIQPQTTVPPHANPNIDEASTLSLSNRYSNRNSPIRDPQDPAREQSLIQFDEDSKQVYPPYHHSFNTNQIDQDGNEAEPSTNTRIDIASPTSPPATTSVTYGSPTFVTMGYQGTRMSIVHTQTTQTNPSTTDLQHSPPNNDINNINQQRPETERNRKKRKFTKCCLGLCSVLSIIAFTTVLFTRIV